MSGVLKKEAGEDWREELQREIESMNAKYGLRLDPVVLTAEADTALCAGPLPLRARTLRPPPLPLFLPESPEQDGWYGSEGDDELIMDGGSEGGTKAVEKIVGALVALEDSTGTNGLPDRALVENNAFPLSSTVKDEKSVQASLPFGHRGTSGHSFGTKAVTKVQSNIKDKKSATNVVIGGSQTKVQEPQTADKAPEKRRRQTASKTSKQEVTAIPNQTKISDKASKSGRPRQTAIQTAEKRKPYDEEPEHQPPAKRARHTDPTDELEVGDGQGSCTATRTDVTKSSGTAVVEAPALTAVAEKTKPKSERGSQNPAEQVEPKLRRRTGAGTAKQSSGASMATARDADLMYLQSWLIRTCRRAADAIVRTFRESTTLDLPEALIFTEIYEDLQQVNLHSGKVKQEVEALLVSLRTLDTINAASLDRCSGQLRETQAKARRLLVKYEIDKVGLGS